MAFLTEAGLKKLGQFEEAVKAIQKKYEAKEVKGSSDYSKKMGKNAIDIIAFIRKNNNKAIPTMDKELEACIAHIDNDSFTAIPTIFNPESFDLAVAFRDFLKNLTIGTDVDKDSFMFTLLKAKSALSRNMTPQRLLDEHSGEVHSNLLSYETVVMGADVFDKVSELGSRCFRLFSPLLEKLEKKEYKEYEEKIFQEEYETLFTSFLAGMRSLPYVAVTSKDPFAAARKEKPHEVEMDKVHTSLAGKNIFQALNRYEAMVNEKLLPGWSPVKIVESYARSLFTEEKVEARKASILALYKDIETEIAVLLSREEKEKNNESGSFLGAMKGRFFCFKMDPRKKILLEGVRAEIKASRNALTHNPDGLSMTIFNVYKKIYEAGKKNVEFVGKSKGKGQRKISLGETAKLLRKFESRILPLAIQREWGDDAEEYQILKKGMEKEKIMIDEARSLCRNGRG